MPSELNVTCLSDVLSNLDKRWNELLSLLNVARDYDIESTSYQSICRACSILICSHIEGSIKEIVSGFVGDLNDYCSTFSKYPIPVRRVYLRECFMDKTIDEKMVSKIDGRLVQSNYKIDPNLITDRHNNVNGNILSQYGLFLGVGNILNYYSGSRLEIIFENDNEDSLSLIGELEETVKDAVSVFPYHCDSLESFSFSESKKKESLFQTFLDKILTSRNQIAHGQFEHSLVSLKDLQDSINKSIVLILGFILIVINCWNKYSFD